MKILNFGSCNIDYVYNVAHFVRPGETLNTSDYYRFIGGKGLNQSIAAARAGAVTLHAGCIGADGEGIREVLESAGVSLNFLETLSVPTGHAVIQVNEDGENCIIIYGGANRALTKDFIDRVMTDCGEDTVVVLQNETSNVDFIIDEAYRRSMQVIFNPAPFEEALCNLDLDKVSFLILNETEALGFSGESDADRVCDYFADRYKSLKLILTLGAEGCIYLDCSSGEKIYQPAFSVNVVDTTAAGDTFLGYFTASVVNGLDIRAALLRATAASAIAISRAGASVSIPTSGEVEAFLAEVRK